MQHFPVVPVLFIMLNRVGPTFESVDEIVNCVLRDSNESLG